MITDPLVFTDEYLPRELMHRESTGGQLSRAFQPAVDGNSANDVLLSGPSGVGKTVLARHTLDRLEAQMDAYHARVRCLGKILRATLDQHPRRRPRAFPESRPSTISENSCVTSSTIPFWSSSTRPIASRRVMSPSPSPASPSLDGDDLPRP